MFKCAHCVKVFTQKSNLCRHVRMSHPEENNKRKQSTNDYPRAVKIARIEDHNTRQPQPYQSTNPYHHQSINPYGHQLYYHPIYFPYTQPNVSSNASSQPNASSQSNASSQPSATQPNDSIQPNVPIQTPPPQIPPSQIPQPQVSKAPPKPPTASKTCEICGKQFKYPRNKKLHMETVHGYKLLRGEGKSRKDIIQIYQHDGNAKMTVQETNQALVKARDEIIMKLYEALQKCKQGIKYDIRMELVFQRSRMNDKGEMENVMTSPVYRKDKIEELHKQEKIGDIEERFDKFIGNFWEYIEELMLEGSGWSFMYIKGIDLKIYDYDVIAGGTYIELPKKIKSKQACINVKNHDNMCFKWAILSARHHNDIIKNPGRVTNYHEYADELNEEGLQYPVKFENKSMMLQLEDNNKLLITVLGLDDDDNVIVYRSPRYARRDIQYNYYDYTPIILLMIHNDDGKSHYVWVKNLSALLSGRDKSENIHQRKSEYCMNCLTRFPSEAKLKKHEAVCVLQGKVIFPEKDKATMKFENFQNKWRVPFVVYADFESLLVKPEAQEEETRKIINNHVPIAVSYSVCSIDPKWRREVKCYTGTDCSEWFMKEMLNLVEEVKHIYRKILPCKKLTPQQRQEAANTTHCYLCKEELDDVRHKDHCHITGEYRGVACRKCNMEHLSLKKVPLPVFFHNFTGYDSKHVIKSFANMNVDIIANTTEQIKCATIKHQLDNGEDVCSTYIKFLDSYAFLNTSLENLSLNLDEADKTPLSDYLKYKCLEKYRGINETNLMYEGRPRYDDEITELARERNAHHYCSNSKFALKPSDDDYRNKIYNPIVLTVAEQEWVDKAMTLIKKKGEFPYEWFDSEEKLNETQLPLQQECYSALQKKSLSDEAYQHVLNVWEHFEFQTFQEYMEFYMCLDVVLLQCIFEKFRTSAQANYGNLDPVRYLSLPALAWDAALQMTNIELQLLTEEDGLYYILEKGIRGGITTATKRHAKETENSSIIYLDANNLYGWAMSQPLPYGGFKLMNDLPFDDDDLTVNISNFIKNKSEGVGYIFEVDVSYPVELHDNHSDLPFLPESFKPKEEMLSDEQKRLFKITYPNRTKYRTTEKLIPHLLPKSNYIAHHSILLQALDNGLKIEKIHRVIEFKEKP